MVRRFAALAALALPLAACGGAATVSGGAPPTSATSAVCDGPAQQRALSRLHADVAAIRRAAALPARDSLHGSPAANRATDRFLLDVATAPVDLLVRNRMIDHAAAALAGACEQCFQALEANRPIPEIARTHDGAACHAS